MLLVEPRPPTSARCLLLRRTPLAPGTFEQDSFEVVSRRRHRSELLDADAVRARFPAWNADAFPHGTYGAEGGYAESGKVIARLIEEARRLGVDLREGIAFERLLDDGMPIVQTRVCLYCDTWDGHFWIARDPDRPRLVVQVRAGARGADRGGGRRARRSAERPLPLAAGVAAGAERGGGAAAGGTLGPMSADSRLTGGG